MVEPGCRHRLHLARHRADQAGKLVRQGGFCKADGGAQPVVGVGQQAGLDPGGELAVEGVPLLLQDHAEVDLGQVGQQPVAQRVDPVIADPLRRLVHLERGFLAHLEPAVQHAIDRRDADIRFARDVGNGRPAHVMAPSIVMEHITMKRGPVQAVFHRRCRRGAAPA